MSGPRPRRAPPLSLRVLAAVVDRPGQLDAPAIAERLLPWTPRPYRTSAERAAVLAERDAHRARALRRVQNALRELARPGNPAVAPVRHVALEALSAAAYAREGLAGLRAPARHETRAGAIVGRHPGAVPGSHAAAIVAALAAGPMTPGELATATGGRCASGHENGAWREAYGRLVEDCIVVASRHRWPTAAGIARVDAARARGLLER